MPPTRRPFLPALLAAGALAAAATLPAQDAIGVTFQGHVLRLDTTTGAVTPLATGLPGKNCLTFDRHNRLWTVVRPNPLFEIWRLARIDPHTGAETIVMPTVNVGDLRGMCVARLADGILAIRNAAPNDELVLIDPDAGTIASIGFADHGAIQGLEDPFGGGIAWDSNAGLLSIGTLTGHTVDNFPGSNDPPALQFLCRNEETNERFVGRGSLYRLNTGTGTTTLVTDFSGNPDLRGMEFLGSRRESFGFGCPLVAPPGLSVQLPILAGGTVQTTTTALVPDAIGALIVGFSEDTFGPVPLPLVLDPLLGTFGCQLLVSADLLLPGLLLASDMQVSFSLPPSAAFQQFYLQSLVLTPTAQGGFAFTQGMRVRSRL